MKLPLIIDEHGDVNIYNSIKSAELYLEAIDVKNNEYIAYDANGLLLNLKVIAQNETLVESVKIEEGELSKPEHLKNVLINFLEALNTSVPPNIELSNLIDICVSKVGYTS